ncbi:D-methionine transport system substrate-binding protein [Homoserinimonas aerilata]|uniref:D-methionine transport system substrate-binding protein n=1 Tax=Homoserinimonas aerilata TaxID=1162970 RepID=A0A542YGQ3_9MICO|nr:MetQ/NlpA family ABC transporter substrate-binding protein [Homoserinimonas aerilata]TQL47231.1 D-methionine transport system substrate-binding protein [Homoserinimonas aerilata]
MSGNTPLIEAPKKRGGLYALIAAAVVVVIAVVVGIVVAVNGANSSNADGGGAGDNAITEGKGSAADPVKIGVVGASDPYWELYKDAAADEGISIELVNFSEYPLPNPALTEGELDLNQFQHIVYLAQYNEDAGEDLTPIGATAIYPLALYSTQYDSVDDIPEGSTVAVPNDPSNLARSLLVLQSAGLVELKGGGSIFSSLADIDEANSKVKVTALEAALTATSLPDVAAAILNNDFVADAGLEFSDAIAKDDPTDPNALPYVNVFAARADDKDNELYLKLVQIFQDTKSVQDGLIEVSGDTAVTLKTPVADLVASLAKVQSDVAAQG